MATMTEEEKKRKGLLGLSNMDAVKQGAMDDVRTRWNSGDVAGAAGAFVRGSLATVPAWVADSNANTAATLAPIGNAVGRFGSGLFGGDTPNSAATAATPAAPAQTVASPRTVGVQAPVQPGVQSMDVGPATEGLAGLEQYRVKSAPAATNDIKKTVDANGNVTYSGSNIGPGATINGQEAGGGYMEVPGARGLASLAQPAASQAPSIQTPTIRHSGNDWQARNDLRSAQISASTLRSDWDRYRDGEIDNRGRATGKGGNAAQDAYQAALQADNGARGLASKAPLEAARLNAGLSQEAMRQDGQSQREGARLGLAALGAQDALATSALARERAGVELEGIRQDAALRRTLTDPNATPEQRKQAQEALLAMRGKQEQANRFTVVPGGQQIDPISGKAYTTPSQVLNNQTGQFIQQPGAQDQAQQTHEVGKIYTDANGNRRRWDGKEFVPV